MATALRRPQSTEPTISIETITPTVAEKLLAGSNVINRKIRESDVRRYARDMLADQWKMTTEAVKLDEDGNILDGQHRLRALVLAGAQADEAGLPEPTFTTVVARNVGGDALVAMDTGVRRRLADVLRWQGEVNVNYLAAAIVLGWRWDNGMVTLTVMPSPQDALVWLEQHPEVRDAVKMTARLAHRPLSLSPAACGTVLTRALMIDPDLAVQFAEEIVSDLDHKQGDPLLALRRWAMRASLDRASLRGWIYAGFMVKAWNAWLTGAEVQNLSFRTRGSKAESFPVMIGVDGLPFSFAPKPPPKRRRKRQS